MVALYHELRLFKSSGVSQALQKRPAADTGRLQIEWASDESDPAMPQLQQVTDGIMNTAGIVHLDIADDWADGTHVEKHRGNVALHEQVDELIYAERMLAAGARGYIMKQAASDQLLVALRRVLAGGTYLSESMARTSRRGRTADIRRWT